MLPKTSNACQVMWRLSSKFPHFVMSGIPLPADAACFSGALPPSLEDLCSVPKPKGKRQRRRTGNLKSASQEYGSPAMMCAEARPSKPLWPPGGSGGRRHQQSFRLAAWIWISWCCLVPCSCLARASGTRKILARAPESGFQIVLLLHQGSPLSLFKISLKGDPSDRWVCAEVPL